MFRFALTTDGESLGPVAFARSDFKRGDVIPQGPGRTLRVVNVVEPHEDEAVLLVDAYLERATTARQSATTPSGFQRVQADS